MARPTKYNKNILKRTNDYIKNFENHGEVIPTIMGLSEFLNVAKRTIYYWTEDPNNKEFLHTIEKLKNKGSSPLR